MDNITEQEKKTLGQKFLEFKKMGLESYGNYLQNELEYSAGKSNRKAYTKYIENELEMNAKKLSEIGRKLGLG